MTDEQFNAIYHKLEDIHGQLTLNGFLLAGLVNIIAGDELKSPIIAKVREASATWNLLDPFSQPKT